MPRRDDYDDTPPGRRDTPFPAGVKTAGVIWIGFGVLGIVGALLNFAVGVGNAAAGGGPGGGGGGMGPNLCGIGCALLVPLAFLMVGVQTVKGTAKGVLGNGIGSLVFGVLFLGIPVLVVSLAARFGAGNEVIVLYVIAGIYGILAIALLAAGVMALMGKQAYEDWRVAQGLTRGRRRTAEQKDYEDDDRPRRRRPRDDDDDR